MDQSLKQQSDAKERDPMGREINNGEKTSNSSEAKEIRRHVLVRREEKSNECNQCIHASSSARDFRTHLKTHSG